MIVKIDNEMKTLIKETFKSFLSENFEIPSQIDDKCDIDNVKFRITPIGCGKDRAVIFSVSIEIKISDNFSAIISATFKS